jgi:signal peptidase I
MWVQITYVYQKMITKTTKIGIVAIIGMVAVGNVASVAYGQFAPTDAGGTTYTNADIAAGKSDHLFKIVEFEVMSESMLPTLQVGQRGLYNQSVAFADLQENDIIVFDCDGLNVSHRIVNIKDFEDGSRAVETKGDNNTGQLDCENKIPESRYIAKVIDASIEVA